jgi:cell division protein FtsL
MNTQSERALRQQRRWANQREAKTNRVRKNIIQKEDDEYDEKQYMDLVETIAIQTLTYMRVQQQLSDARREIQRLQQELEDITLERNWLKKNFDELSRMT